MDTTQVNKYQVNNVVEAFTIVDHLIDNDSKLGLTQICNLMGCTKNKVFRLLATLEHCGIVEKDLQNKYTIGLPMFQAARKVMFKKSLRDRIQPFLSEVSELVNESTYLAYMGDDGLMLVDYVDCSRPIKVASLVGRVVKLGNDSLHTNEIRSLSHISDFMVAIGVFDPEVTAVIAPFDDYSNSGYGALVVIAPNSRMPMDRIKSEIVPSLRSVMQFHSLFKLSDNTIVKPLLSDEQRVSGLNGVNTEKLNIHRSKLRDNSLNKHVDNLMTVAFL